MTYILYIWTVVAIAGDRHAISERSVDWRPIGEYHSSNLPNESYIDAKSKCEAAAQQLGLKVDRYRCVRSK